MSEIFVIGLGEYGLTAAQSELLQSCKLIIAGKRLAATLGELTTPVYPITPLRSAFEAMEKGLSEGNIAVLASGDPLFFGIARRLIEHFGRERLRISPALSSVQLACSRFAIPWDDAKFVSLHGRGEHHSAGMLLSNTKTFVLTDQKNAPDTIAKEILSYLHSIGEEDLIDQCRLFIAEDLGSDKEKITNGTLAEIAALTFSDLNVLVLLQPQRPERSRFGLHEDEIIHSRGLITKDEVRAASLHRLRLPQRGVFWDIGGGSGSISIEAASMNPQLTVYTVERKEEELENIKRNIRKFRCFNVIPLNGMATDILGDLPDPDCVFVGGSGGEMPLIIKEAAARLPQHGRLVINGVIEKTIEAAPQLMEAEGLSVEMSRIEIKRTGPNGPIRFNPITIMVGKK